MKTISIVKMRKYIFMSIALVIVLSIGISFCVWDINSIANKFESGSAFYGNKYAIGIDNNSNNVADIGDTIYFGNYYQGNDEINKSAVEWRVVDIRIENEKEIMYLWSEKVMTIGAYYGYESYYDKDGVYHTINGIRVDRPIYFDSTVRAWLNSENRSDNGSIGFANPPKGNRKSFNGFYNEAFNSAEKDKIVARNIAESGNSSALLDQKMWIPSYREVYGNLQLNGVAPSDSLTESQFSYYEGVSLEGDERLKVEITTYSVSEYSSYINLDAANNNLYTNWVEGMRRAGYMLRSPGVGSIFASMSRISDDGKYSPAASYLSTGVRPAMCLVR